MTKDNISFIHWSAVCIHFEAKEMVQFNTQALDYHFPILNNLCTDPQSIFKTTFKSLIVLK